MLQLFGNDPTISASKKLYLPTESKLIVDSCVVASGKAERPGFKPTVVAHARVLRPDVRSACSTCSSGANGLINWSVRRGASETRFTLNVWTSGPLILSSFPSEILEVAFDISSAVKDENPRVCVGAPEFVPRLEASRACGWAKPRAAAIVRTIVISSTALMIKIEDRSAELSSDPQANSDLAALRRKNAQKRSSLSWPRSSVAVRPATGSE